MNLKVILFWYRGMIKIHTMMLRETCSHRIETPTDASAPASPYVRISPIPCQLDLSSVAINCVCIISTS